MKKIFGYVFYKIYETIKIINDKDDFPEWTAILLLAINQYLNIYILLILLELKAIVFSSENSVLIFSPIIYR